MGQKFKLVGDYWGIQETIHTNRAFAEANLRPIAENIIAEAAPIDHNDISDYYVTPYEFHMKTQTAGVQPRFGYKAGCHHDAAHLEALFRDRSLNGLAKAGGRRRNSDGSRRKNTTGKRKKK